MFLQWKLKRLQAAGVSVHHMKTAYTTYIRSTVEYGLIPAWNLLTDDQKNSLEAVQRRVTRTLLGIGKRFGEDVPSYEERVVQLAIPTMKERMMYRTGDFAKKLERHPLYANFFQENPELGRRRPTSTRPYLQPLCHTNRRANAPIMAAVTYINRLSSSRDSRLAKHQTEEEEVIPLIHETDYV